jgi:cell division protein FtsI/penicillin-binding protein 2
MGAYAPADNPLIALAVHVEHGCHGTTAGPTIRDIFIAYFKKYHPEMLKNVDVKIKPLSHPTENDE